jgi:hypothetical protein
MVGAALPQFDFCLAVTRPSSQRLAGWIQLVYQECEVGLDGTAK